MYVFILFIYLINYELINSDILFICIFYFFYCISFWNPLLKARFMLLANNNKKKYLAIH